MKTETVSVPHRGRPQSYLPLGNKGQKFTISAVLARLKPNEKGEKMSRVSVTNRVNQLAESGAIKAVDKVKSEGRGRPSVKYLILQTLPSAASYRRTKAQVVKAKAQNKVSKSKPAKKVAAPAPKSTKAPRKASKTAPAAPVVPGLPATTEVQTPA